MKSSLLRPSYWCTLISKLRKRCPERTCLEVVLEVCHPTPPLSWKWLWNRNISFESIVKVDLESSMLHDSSKFVERRMLVQLIVLSSPPRKLSYSRSWQIRMFQDEIPELLNFKKVIESLYFIWGQSRPSVADFDQKFIIMSTSHNSDSTPTVSRTYFFRLKLSKYSSLDVMRWEDLQRCRSWSIWVIYSRIYRTPSPRAAKDTDHAAQDSHWDYEDTNKLSMFVFHWFSDEIVDF